MGCRRRRCLPPRGNGIGLSRLDVASGVLAGCVYVAARWLSPNYDPQSGDRRYMTVNFSEDGDDWCGWRIPESDIDYHHYQPTASAGVAAADGHVYIFAPGTADYIGGPAPVWAY